MHATNDIHIFRAGKHTAMQGATITFAESDLAATAKAYDPKLHEAPLVIGHPAADAPAWGWVGKLAAEKNGLFASPSQLDPAFAELVRAGRFKKVSASFYAPDNPNNPVPGVYYLRHVGFLGAQPPAVKGLAPVNFAENDTDEGCVTFDFAESPWFLRQFADLLQRVREYIVERDGADTADRVIPSYAVSDMQEQAAQAAAQEADIPAFTENETKPKENSTMASNENPPVTPTDTLQADFAEAKARAENLERQVAALTAAARLDRARRSVDKFISEGRLTPAQSQGLVEFMAGLDEEGTFDFAEADGKKATTSPAAFMKAFLERLPKQVDFGEAAPGGESESAGLAPAELARKALDYCEEMRGKGVTVSITEAVARMSGK